MAAPAIDAVLEELSGMISDEIYYNGLHTSPWIDLLEQDNWPEGQGHSINVLSYDRSLPANPIEWDDVTLSDGEAGGGCLPPKQSIEITKTMRNFNLQHTALESPNLCVKDLRDAFQAGEQMSQIMQILSENTREVWINRNRDEYTRVSENKGIVTLGGILYDDTWAATEPTSVLTAGALKRAFAKQVRTSSGKGSYGMVDGRPTFVALTSMETSENLFSENTNSGHRDDVRYSNRVPELLAPLGAERLFKGFWLIDDLFVPRWNFSSGAFVRVPARVWSSGKLIDNPAYETALYEDTIIFNPLVEKSIIPTPEHNYGQATFDPVKYRGEWRWLNVQHIDDNPDRSWGRFRGVFESGTKPIYPQNGIVLRHLRCGFHMNGAACDES